jgi:hypothetical protein
MALEGSFKDFGLAEIFQLIGLQKKTGVLTVKGGDESQVVTVSFEKGMVAFADEYQRGEKERLGSLLLRADLISAEDLERAVQTQKETLQRLGHVLVQMNFISQKNLSQALQSQVKETVYRLFRLKEGSFLFSTESIAYDKDMYKPIAAEFLLMEGVRMIDEWPIIERKITSSQMVFQKTKAALQAYHSVESIDQNDIEFDFSFDADMNAEASAASPQNEELSLSSDDLEILQLVDGVSTVERLNDRTILSDFDTYRVLADLLTRNLIDEVQVNVPKAVASKRSHAGRTASRWLLNLILACTAVISLGTLQDNPWTPWRMGGEVAASEELRGYSTHARLERLEQAITVYFLDAGLFPENLSSLAESGYIDPADQLDPCGRPFGFEISSGGYQLFSIPAHGQPTDPELTISHRFSASQRMMLEDQP